MKKRLIIGILFGGLFLATILIFCYSYGEDYKNLLVNYSEGLGFALLKGIAPIILSIVIIAEVDLLFNTMYFASKNKRKKYNIIFNIACSAISCIIIFLTIGMIFWEMALGVERIILLSVGVNCFMRIIQFVLWLHFGD